MARIGRSSSASDLTAARRPVPLSQSGGDHGDRSLVDDHVVAAAELAIDLFEDREVGRRGAEHDVADVEGGHSAGGEGGDHVGVIGLGEQRDLAGRGSTSTPPSSHTRARHRSITSGGMTLGRSSHRRPVTMITM